MILVDAEMPIRCSVCHLPKAGICNRSAMPDMSGKNKCPIITEIPDNATNGDVIKALFPYIEPKTVGYTEYVGDTEVHGREVVIGDRICLDKDWWNAPYRKELWDDSNTINEVSE